MEYAGVFIADSESDRVFSDSEPPTHDDWSPDMLDQSSYKTIVRVSLRNINSAMSDFAGGGAGVAPKGSDQLPLGALADKLGGIIAGITGTGTLTITEPDRPTKKGKPKSGQRRPTVSVIGSNLQAVSNDLLHLYVDFSVTYPPGCDAVTVTGTANVVIEGGGLESEAPEGSVVPKLVEWRDSTNALIARGATVTISQDGKGPFRAVAAVPADAVSTVVLEVE